MKQVNMNEFDKLVEYLRSEGIPHSVNERPMCRKMLKDLQALSEYELDDYEAGKQVVVYTDETCRRKAWDAICGYGSYGVSEGLLEVMGHGVVIDEKNVVEGYLTADEVIRRLRSEGR